MDPDTSGLQVDVWVQVNDLQNDIALEDIELRHSENETKHRAWVRDGRNGRFAFFPGVTVAESGHDGAVSLEARVPRLTRRTQDENGDGQPDALMMQTDEVAFEVHLPVKTGELCGDPTWVSEDLVIDEENPGAFLAEEDCIAVEGNVRIESSALLDMQNLAGLQKITGDLRIVGNANLIDLSDLKHLVEIGGDFHIEGNQTLPTISEVHALRDHIGLTRIGGTVRIQSNGPG